LREYGIKREPRVLLEKVRGLELREMKDTDVCCGFGGTFAVKAEPISVSMGEQKMENVAATNAEYLISTDVSCLMHLNGIAKTKNNPVKMMHLCDVLASGWD
jgi:L-lactate dehydrogenase complex protein LldE